MGRQVKHRIDNYETPEEDLDCIVELIKEGYASGRVDTEYRHTVWNLNFNTWED